MNAAAFEEGPQPNTIIRPKGKPCYVRLVDGPLGMVWEVVSLQGDKMGAFSFPGEPEVGAQKAVEFAMHAAMGK